jgi:hypothetical protein
MIFDDGYLGRTSYPDVINPFDIQLSSSQGTPLSASFRFDFVTHDLRNLLISGPFVDDRVYKISKEVDEHAEWSDDEVAARLKAAGAKFGPDDREAFLRALPLKKLEPVTGPLELVDAGFIGRNRVGDEPVTNLGWIVSAKLYSADGKYETDTILLFEPFEGALWSYRIRSPWRPVGSKR